MFGAGASLRQVTACTSQSMPCTLQAVRFVVVQAHPHEHCLNSALRDGVAAALRAGGCDVVVVRLMQGEWIDAEGLAGAEGLVLVYPTWWGGLPAPMLGWVQSELADWIDGHRDLSSSPLRMVRRFAAVVTHGSPRRINRLQGEPGLHLLKRSVVRLCAPGIRLRWVAFYGIDKRPSGEVSAFVDRVAVEAAGLVP